MPIQAGRTIADKKSSIYERLISVSSELLGKRFKLGPTGEGINASLGLPVLTLERFDCLTFVETVISLALASSADHAVAIAKTLRYGTDRPSFAARNHFAGVDWIPSAIKQGLLDYALPPQMYAKAAIRIQRREWCNKLAENPMY